MFHTPTIVVNPPQTNQGSVLGLIVAESCLGQILEAVHLAQLLTEIAALRKQQHVERLQRFLTHRKDAAKRCREAVLGPTPEVRKPQQVVAEQTKLRPTYWTRLADRPTTTFAYDIHVTGRYGKVYQVTYAPKGQGRRGLNNWCPDCKEYVARSHQTPQGLSHEEYIEQRAQREAAHLAELRYGLGNPVHRTRMQSLKAWKDGPINTNLVEDEWLRILDRKAGRSEQANETKAAPKTQRKGKRHYVRHAVADLQFVRKQDLNLATNI